MNHSQWYEDNEHEVFFLVILGEDIQGVTGGKDQTSGGCSLC